MSAPERNALRYPGKCDGIDVSNVQGVFSYKAVAEAGFTFATVKASEGVSYCDPKAIEHLKGFRDAGLICNTYTFLRPSQGDARAQVKKAFDCSGDEFPLRLALDAEGAPDWMVAAEIITFYETCIDETLSNGVLFPELYSFPYFVKSRLMPAIETSALIGMCPYWGAAYGSNTAPWVPGPLSEPWYPNPPFSKWWKHQYSGNGGYRVPGIYGDCDRNLFNGDLAALRKYYGLVDPDAPTQPDMTIHPDVPRVTIPYDFDPEK